MMQQRQRDNAIPISEGEDVDKRQGVDKAPHGADELGGDGGNGRAGHAPVERQNEQQIQPCLLYTSDEISYDQIPMLDAESAMKLGNRKLGELADMVSQFEVADDYTQINYQGRPVRVTPLRYGDIIKWLNNLSLIHI